MGLDNIQEAKRHTHTGREKELNCFTESLNDTFAATQISKCFYLLMPNCSLCFSFFFAVVAVALASVCARPTKKNSFSAIHFNMKTTATTFFMSLNYQKKNCKQTKPKSK